MAKKGQVFQKVPLENKLTIVKMHLAEGRLAHTIAREYGVSSQTIYTRCRHESQESASNHDQVRVATDLYQLVTPQLR